MSSDLPDHRLTSPEFVSDYPTIRLVRLKDELLFWIVLLNLVPEFLSILASEDHLSTYQQYLDRHSSLLQAYWRNYVIDPDSPHAGEVIATSLAADRQDLHALLSEVDLVRLAEDAIARAEDAFQVDRPVDVVLMVGVGGANAGELVVGGKGIAFVCVEHFTGRVNPSSFGMGLSPGLIPVWIAHEIAHCVRYTSPTSESELRRLVTEQNGYYDFWATGSRATLRELLVNEGVAVHASQAVAPGYAPPDYFGYPRRQYARMRELESFLRRSVKDELDQAGLGFRLRYLMGGATAATRLVQGKVLPERSGYYLGHRMTEALVQSVGIPKALRASAEVFAEAEKEALGIRSA